MISFLSIKDKQLEELAAVNFSTFAVNISNVFEIANNTIPERLAKIRTKCQLSCIDSELLDQLGIDFVIEFMGQRFAIDVTTGKSTVIKNKKAKLSSMNLFLRAINACPVVVQIRSGFTTKSIIEELIRAPVCKTTGVIDCRIRG